MGNGYLGKISAVVSANTSDFQSKLNGAAKDVQKFASSMQSSLTAAQTKATTSLRGIYTEAQKLERALQAASTGKLSFKGFAGPDLDSAVSRMRAFASVTKEIGGPLTAATKSFNQLSMEVQGEFNPALRQAQVLTERLADTINKTGTVSEERFQRVAGAVNVAVDSMKRLSEASKLVGGLATGKELRFSNPQFVAEATRSQRLQQEAAALSPSSISSGGFAGLVSQIAAAAAEAERLNAALENEAQLVNGDVPAATAKLTAQLAVWRSLNDELERRKSIENNIGAKTDISQTGLSSSIAAQRIKEREAEIAKNIGLKTDISQTGLSSSIAAQRIKEREAEIAKIIGLKTDISQTGLSSDLAAGQRAQRRRQASEVLGTDNASASEMPRQLRSVGQRIVNLRSQLESLPATLRQGMLPALNAIQNEFIQMAGDLTPTINAIDSLESSLQDAEQAARRLAAAMEIVQGHGGAGTAGVEFGLDQAAASRMTAQLNVLQSELSLVSAEARGPGVAAFNNLRSAIAAAMANGTIATESVQRELAGLRNQAVSTIASLRGIDAGSLANSVAQAGSRRQGDISRMGAGNASLAIQQLGFAIDDFMSSTGGFDQQLRAVSNNISQMAFILGGTTGLFVGLGVTITAQAALALTKWINGGREAEDQTKSLNDAISRQKSLVEELAQAYRSLGDSLTRNVFSKATEESRSFAKDRDEVMKKRREQAEERIAAASPEVARERATQAMLERQIDSATSVGRVILLQKQLRESKEREKRAREEAVNSQNVGRDEAAAAIRVAGEAESAGMSFFEAFVPGVADYDDRRGRMKAARQRAEQAAAAGSDVELRAALQDQLAAMTGAQGYMPGDNSAVDQAVQRLELLIAQLDNKIKIATDNKVVQGIIDAGIQVSRSLSAVQSLIDENIAPFSSTRDQAEKVAARLEQITDELEQGTTPERNAALQKEMEALNSQAAAHRSAAEVVRVFADTLKRISTDLAGSVAESAVSAAGDARREANRAAAANVVNGEFDASGNRRRPGDAAREADRAVARRADAEREARRSQDDAARVRRENDQRRREFEADIASDPQVAAERRRLEQLQRILDSDTASAEEKSKAAEEKAAIQSRQERRFEDSPQGQAAKAAADAADRRNAAERERQRQRDERFNAAERGRDIGLRDSEVAAREARNGMLDIVAARDEGLLSRRQANEQASRFGREQLEQAAPAIASMAEEVQNAILQGPSRAALEVTDVSTVQGQKELNRLLRGDDSAKNANIVELEKQNQKLVEVVAVLKDIARRAGIVLDL
jgi:hypothetical protein